MKLAAALLAVAASGAITNGEEALAPPSTDVPSCVDLMLSNVGSPSTTTESSCQPEAPFCIDTNGSGLIELIIEDVGADDDGQTDLPSPCETGVTVIPQSMSCNVISTFTTSELTDSVTHAAATSELDQMGSITTETHATHAALGNDHDRATITSSTISTHAASTFENASKGGSNATDTSASKTPSTGAIAGLVAGTGICAAAAVCLMGWLLYRRCRVADRRSEQPRKDMFELDATECSAGASEHELTGEHLGGQVIGTPIAELP